MVGVPERQFAVLKRRAEVAQHRIEVVLRVPRHDAAGERPHRAPRPPNSRQQHDRERGAGSRGPGRIRDVDPARPAASAAPWMDRRSCRLAVLQLPSAAACGGPSSRTTLRLVFGREKGETVAADGPFLASSSVALMAPDRHEADHERNPRPPAVPPLGRAAPSDRARPDARGDRDAPHHRDAGAGPWPAGALALHRARRRGAAPDRRGDRGGVQGRQPGGKARNGRVRARPARPRAARHRGRVPGARRTSRSRTGSRSCRPALSA